MAGMGFVFFFFPYVLLRLFTNDPDVIGYGILYMKIVAFATLRVGSYREYIPNSR